MTHSGTAGLLATGTRTFQKAAHFRKTFGWVFGVAAPVALAVGSAAALGDASGSIERVEAGHGLLWAAQGGAEFAGSKFASLAAGVGLLGGTAQMGVGLYRMVTGIRSKNWSKAATGLLDTTAGAAWAITAVKATPIAMTVFIGATVIKTLQTEAPNIARGFRNLSRFFSRAPRAIGVANSQTASL